MSSAELRAARAVKVAKRNSYENRKRNVDLIYYNTNAVVGLMPNAVNNAITEVETDYANAIKGKQSSLTASFEETVQKSISSDSTLSISLSKLSSESSYCIGKINTLNAEIADLDRQIAAAVAAEEEAARRAAEAAAAASRRE